MAAAKPQNIEQRITFVEQCIQKCIASKTPNEEQASSLQKMIDALIEDQDAINQRMDEIYVSFDRILEQWGLLGSDKEAGEDNEPEEMEEDGDDAETKPDGKRAKDNGIEIKF